MRASLKAGALAAALAAGALATYATPPASATAGDPAADGWYAYTARLAIGDNVRACTGALVDRYWVITAASCFAENPAQPTSVDGAPKWPTTVTVGRTDLTATNSGASSSVERLVARSDRDLVMAKLTTPIDTIAPLRVATTAPTAAENLRVPGYGRTKTEWVPNRLHTGAFTVNGVRPTAVDTVGTNGAAVCKGDTGAPVVRETAPGRTELVAVASRSWQGGCLGETETRTGAVNTRTDDLAGWVQQTRATAVGWKTQVLIRSDANLYHSTRLYDGTWTPYEDVQATAGNIGGVRAVATAGINADTHIIALGGDGHLHYAIRNLNGGWNQRFVDLNIALNDLGNITQVSISAIGNDLHVAIVADGYLFHTVRNGDGQWSPFGVVTDAAGPLQGITSISTAGTAGGELHIAAVSGGRIYHTLRTASGNWGAWGSVAEAAGATAPVTSVAVSRQNSDLNLAFIATDGQYHTMRWANGTWQPNASLGGVVGNITGTSISAAAVDTEARFAITTTDNKVVLTARHTDGTWATTETLDLTSIPGNHTGTVITGSL
ncbi:trypsin-like serine protease [Kitasatospora sp. NPDC057692]|uniref:trypsin-like serine protease n=1 Tax=Kitasatospora sp. NPDC057692 TaxID=3346215 RepID=UPI003698F947